jgi:protein tyrosine phosphatase
LINLDDALHSENNNILIHCSAGISRSPTLVLAYMIKKEHITLDAAFNKMRKLRQIVDPNISFILQLRDWEKKCLTTETSDDNSMNSGANYCTNTRPTSSAYCGSTSKTKQDSKPRTDSIIIVN